jgi:hypothetical protein
LHVPLKNEPHIRVPAAFPGSGWDKLCGKIHLDLKTNGRLLMRCKSAVFWQTKHYSGLFSIVTGKERFSGFSGIVPETVYGNGARIGRILSLRSSRKEKRKMFI